MEGKTYQARGGRVRMDDAGLDVYSRRHGGVRLPWPVIVDIKIGTAGKSAERCVLTVHRADGESLTLPAPIGPVWQRESFDTQAREIIDAYEDRGAGWRESASGEPRDEIPVDYRVESVKQIVYYGHPSRLSEFARPLNVLLSVLLLGCLVGLGGSIHSYTRELPAYDSFRTASPCRVAFSARGAVWPAYCTVPQGTVENFMTGPSDGLYSLFVEPADASEMVPDLQNAGPGQYAFFTTDPAALQNLQTGDPIGYVVTAGGDAASVTVNGVTYPTIDSPDGQYISDWAAIFASGFLMLVFAGLLGLRIARRRPTGLWGLLPFACVAAFAANFAVATSGPAGSGPSSVPSLLELTGFVASGTAVAGAAVLIGWFRPRGPRPVSRPRRVLP